MLIFASESPSGKGWVGEVLSPGTLLCTTGLLVQPNTGCPVSAFRIQTWPCLVDWTIAFNFLPPLVIVTGTGAAMVSMSHRSWRLFWKPHLILPVMASSATVESAHLLSPGRQTPTKSGLPESVCT